MACFPADCPHCGLQRVSCQIHGARAWPLSTYWQEDSKTDRRIRTLRGYVTAGASCPECNEPISARLAIDRDVTAYHDLLSLCGALVKDSSSITALGFALDEVWPKQPEPRLPDHLPQSVESAFLQAERAFARGDTDAAGMMYRRALETALKITFPGVSGSLFQRITTLVASHDLSHAIGQWAHEVRIIGNEAAHDTDSLSVEDMRATRNFVDAVLRYAISLPKEIELRRAATAPAEGPALPPQ